MKKVILTEDQIKRMVDKLVVSEQNEVRTESLTVPLGSIWPMGYWKLTSSQISKLNPELSKITNFINKNKGSNITIQIVAGESKVTNVDNEDPSKPKLATGILSQKRGEQMVNYLGKYFKDLLDNGSIDKLPKIPEPQTKIGDTPYNGSNDLKNPKLTSLYQKEQFVSAIISTSKDYECLVGMEITVGYYKGKNSSDHQCDEAIFDLRMNGVSIGIVNLNNGILDVIDTQRIDDEINKMYDYESKVKNAEESWKEAVASGKIKKPDQQKWSNYMFKMIGDNSNVDYSTAERLMSYAFRGGFIKDYKSFKTRVIEINKSFEKNGRITNNEFGGSRSQTFTLDGTKAKSIIDNAPAQEIILSIVPLVSDEGEYSIYYEAGSHADTPWVTIKSNKSNDLLYNNEPNVKMKRGSTQETILLRTDLCGKPPKK